MVEQWVDHPATELTRTILDNAVEWLKDIRKDLYFDGEPHRTQEEIGKMNARIEAAESLKNLLTKDGLISEELYLEQLQRHNAERVSNTH
jgi:hypothetical protein